MNHSLLVQSEVDFQPTTDRESDRVFVIFNCKSLVTSTKMLSVKVDGFTWAEAR